MKKDKLKRSKGYNVAKIQMDLFNEVNDYLVDGGINKTEFAKELGVSKGYVSQVLNGDFDFRLSKLVELSLAIGKRPVLRFEKFENDSKGETKIIKFAEYKFDKKTNMNCETALKATDFIIYDIAK